MTDCKSITKDIEHIKSMAEIFASPSSFWYHVGIEILVNGVEIKGDVDNALSSWKNSDYYNFGFYIGEALSLVAMGSPDEATMCMEDRSTYEVLHGYTHVATKGMVDGQYLYNNVHGLGKDFLFALKSIAELEDY